MHTFISRKYKVLNLWYWYVVCVKRNRKHWDLDRSNRWRYGWESDTKLIHKKLHNRFNLCVRIFDDEAKKTITNIKNIYVNVYTL
jgi:hypothetical protein